MRALAVAAEDRAAFVAREAGEDEVLARDVLILLAEFGSRDSLFRTVVVDAEGRDSVSTRIGAYEIAEHVGEGAMGVVYRARRAGLDRDVALKVLKADVKDERARASFLREAQVLGRLEHAGIARIYDAGTHLDESGARPWLVLEFVPGTTLDEHVRNADPPMRRRVEILRQIAEAAGAAHAEGIVHGDLKPSNVLIRTDGVVKIVDFGVARCATEVDPALSSSGWPFGTLRYMSPEQTDLPAGAIDARSDVYALGVIAYELLGDESPHGPCGALDRDVLRAIRDLDPVPLRRLRADVPRELDAIVATAMAKEPARRYANGRALAVDFDRYLRGQTVEARPPGVCERALRLVRRRRPVFGAIATSLLALAIGWLMTWRAYAEYHEVLGGRDQLAYGRVLDVLESRADELYPAEPERLADIDAWIADAEQLIRDVERETATVEGSSEPRNARMRETQDVQRALVRRMATFAGPGGTYRAVLERGRRARTLHEQTVVARRGDWDAAIQRIRAGEEYGGLTIEAQVGLVPLGPDSESGLEEFALFDVTASIPTRDRASGVLDLADDAAIVLVLAPGGSFLMGAQATEPGEPNYWATADVNAMPPHVRKVEPFLVSKFELTRAQWIATGLPDPSYGPVGTVHAGGIMTLRTPVDSMDWFEANGYVRRLGLDLPTEAQWEYVARAGSTTNWWCGDDEMSLVDAGNLRNPAYAILGSRPAADVYEHTAPVGLFRANPWGLHDVYGNVNEFCRDVVRHGPYALDGMPDEPTETGWRVARGGSGGDLLRACNSSNRAFLRPEDTNAGVGLRPTRALRGRWSRTGR